MLRLIGASIFIALLAHVTGFVAISEMAISFAGIMIVIALILGVLIVLFN